MTLAVRMHPGDPILINMQAPNPTSGPKAFPSLQGAGVPAVADVSQTARMNQSILRYFMEY